MLGVIQHVHACIQGLDECLPFSHPNLLHWTLPHLCIAGDFSQGLLPATGAPGIVVPMGLHSTLGTPTTLQIGARPFAESTLIEIAYAYQQATQHRIAPPLFPECVDVPSRNTTTMAGTATAGRR